MDVETVAINSDDVDAARSLKVVNKGGHQVPHAQAGEPQARAVQTLYRAFDDFENQLLHATFLIDGEGKRPGSSGPQPIPSSMSSSHQGRGQAGSIRFLSNDDLRDVELERLRCPCSTIFILRWHRDAIGSRFTLIRGVGAIADALNESLLPEGYFAEEHAHLGPFVEIDVATYTDSETSAERAGGMLLLSPARGLPWFRHWSCPRRSPTPSKSWYSRAREVVDWSPPSNWSVPATRTATAIARYSRSNSASYLVLGHQPDRDRYRH